MADCGVTLLVTVNERATAANLSNSEMSVYSYGSCELRQLGIKQSIPLIQCSDFLRTRAWQVFPS